MRALRLLGRETGLPRPRRPIRLWGALEPRPPVPVFRRLRNGLLTTAGLLCALLVLGHLHERLSAQGRGAQEGLLGRTFVSAGSRQVHRPPGARGIETERVIPARAPRR